MAQRYRKNRRPGTVAVQKRFMAVAAWYNDKLGKEASCGIAANSSSYRSRPRAGAAAPVWRAARAGERKLVRTLSAALSAERSAGAHSERLCRGRQLRPRDRRCAARAARIRSNPTAVICRRRNIRTTRGAPRRKARWAWWCQNALVSSSNCDGAPERSGRKRPDCRRAT